MSEVSFLSLLEEFAREQERDHTFFQALEKGDVSAEVIDYIYQRLYVRRKFLAQLRNVRPQVSSPEERQVLLEKIAAVLEGEKTIARHLHDIRSLLHEKQVRLRRQRQALKAYQLVS